MNVERLGFDPPRIPPRPFFASSTTCSVAKPNNLTWPRIGRKVLEHFSGTLCVDELHLGRFTLLLATDPPC